MQIVEVEGFECNEKLRIAGVDEVGRGAWAGPIVAAAVILNKPILGLKDSKRTTKLGRLALNEIIKENAFAWAIAEIPANHIDAIGVGEANRLVMRMAIEQLSIRPDLVRVDGFSCNTHILEEVYIKGDALIPEISAASIIAKVYRDNIMTQFHHTYPSYAFDAHVGYGTQKHVKALQAYGPCSIHRFSFAPLAKYAK